VPEDAMEELRTAYHTNAARNLFLTNELLKLMEAFQTDGIDAIPIKGPVLAKGVYGDVTHRQFDDLDILVREGDVALVSELLMDRGYSPVVTSVGSEAETILNEEGECGYVSPDNLYQVDVHWQMVPRSFLDLDHEDLWERSGTVILGGKLLRTFSSEDLLVLLCIHSMRHLWGRQAWICDVAQLVRAHPALDWDQVFDRDRPLQVERFLNVGLLLASWYDDLELPEWVFNQIQADRVARDLVDDLRVSPSFHIPQEISLIKMTLMNARAREGIRNKVRYFLGQILSPSLEDWSLVRMPANGHRFYNLIRPVRLLIEYGLKPLKKKKEAQRKEQPLNEGEAVRTI
jgi:hypothetical protein